MACSFNGSIIDVVARAEGVDPSLVLRRFSGKAVTHKPASPPKKVYKTLVELSASMPGVVEAVYEYTNPSTGKPDMVVIRSKSTEGKTFRQARPVEGGYVFEAPEKLWPLYNRSMVKQADSIVIVEGEKCVHALHDFGIVATTSPGGAKNAGNADWSPLAGKNIILWPDHDVAGKRYIEDVRAILERLEPAPRLTFIDPVELDLTESEDAADYIAQLKVVCQDRAEVQAALAEALGRARPRGYADDVGREIESIVAGKRRIIQTPWSNLDHLARPLLPGTICLLAGNPSASKSFMVLQILSYALDSGIKATVFELEEGREHYLFRLLAQKSSNANMTDSEWIESNPELAQQIQRQWSDWLNNIGKAIHICQNAGITLSQLAAWIEGQAKAGTKLIIVDPLSAADHVGRDIWAEDAKFIMQTKRIAVEHGVCVMLVTHPVKAVSIPELGQLSGGAALGRFIQCVLWLEAHDKKTGSVVTSCGTADASYNRTLHILKARNARGSGLRIAMTFRSDSLVFTEQGTAVKHKKRASDQDNFQADIQEEI
jgi:hypothetical protein